MCSYYPLYPPPLGACLDTSLGQALDMPCTPDIMLFPSDLAPFAKLVPCGASHYQAASSAGDSKTVCINPGRLVKDKSGATYAWLQASYACLCSLKDACVCLLVHMYTVTAQKRAACDVMPHGRQSKRQQSLRQAGLDKNMSEPQALLQVAAFEASADAAQPMAIQADATLPHRVDERCYAEIRRI